MLMIRRRCAPTEPYHETLILPFELRRKSRLRTRLQSGEEVGIVLERGGILRDGDHLLGDDGRVVQVSAAIEPVLRVECINGQALARAAYHLGNRHVALQIGTGWLRLGHDPVLKELLLGLGAEVIEENAAFEPEAGAYGNGARHGHEPEAPSLMREWTALNTSIAVDN